MAEQNETRDDLEFRKLRVETRKMLAEMEKDLEHRYHWKAQQRYWQGAVLLAALAIVSSPFLTAIAKHYFP